MEFSAPCCAGDVSSCFAPKIVDCIDSMNPITFWNCFSCIQLNRVGFKNAITGRVVFDYVDTSEGILMEIGNADKGLARFTFQG
eukprot:scaffold674967_cov79-Prasinocladus_malaysianus.AAC.1